MRFVTRSCLGLLVLSLAGAAPAAAAVPHTVEPGETLWSIAAASNLTTRALAAANGLSEDAGVVAGSTIQVPSEQEAAAALAGVAPAGAQQAGASATQPAAASAPPPMGAYTVQPGDTLSGIAARSNIEVGAVAWMNGLDPSAPLLAGTVLKLPTGSPLAAAVPTAGPPQVVPQAAPYATPGRVTGSQVASIAASEGVPASLAAAVAWQESGFNNGFVSAANARGVMQLLPGTWQWVQDQLAARPLDPASALDNVNAGVLYLGQLLRDAGGDPARALASYYQGSLSVQNRGVLPDTQRYVDDVLALRSRFGGP
jgi:LysM repeat protein